MNNVDKNQIKKTVANMFADGKLPGDEFGLTWDMLSKMENDCPELTSRANSKSEHPKSA